jgi:hypothetical protein
VPGKTKKFRTIHSLSILGEGVAEAGGGEALLTAPSGLGVRVRLGDKGIGEAASPAPIAGLGVKGKAVGNGVKVVAGVGMGSGVVVTISVGIKVACSSWVANWAFSVCKAAMVAAKFCSGVAVPSRPI